MTQPTIFEHVAAAIEVPTDGTLSKVLYKDDSIRVVGFGFDTGQELTEHTAAVPAIVQVVRGKLHVSLAGEAVEASPGTWIHMPAGLAHSIVALEPSVMLLTLIRAGG